MAERALFVLLCAALLAGCSADLWWTPDQQGQRALEAGRFDEAAERFRDPMWRGVALYRAGRFDEAAASFGRTTTAEGAYARGNALVFTGDYDGAIESYDRALALRPDWTLARDNRALAAARKARLAPPEDDAGGTGGMLEADELVFDDRAKNAPAGEQELGAGEPLSDSELRALWLERVETRPADFLRAKFANQLARDQVEGER